MTTGVGWTNRRRARKKGRTSVRPFLRLLNERLVIHIHAVDDRFHAFDSFCILNGAIGFVMAFRRAAQSYDAVDRFHVNVGGTYRLVRHQFTFHLRRDPGIGDLRAL